MENKMKHKTGCKCKSCTKQGYELEKKGDFWIRLIFPESWKWLEDRRKDTHLE